MRRADRLFQIVHKLRGGRLVTARQLAEKLEVSERTIYRDIADLQARIDAAGDAADHDAGDVEAIECQLHVHGGVHHADTAQEQDNVLAGKLAGDEAAAIDHMLRGLPDLALERRPFGLKG